MMNTQNNVIYIVMVTIKLSLKVNFFTIKDQVIVNFS